MGVLRVHLCRLDSCPSAGYCLYVGQVFVLVLNSPLLLYKCLQFAFHLMALLNYGCALASVLLKGTKDPSMLGGQT